MQATLDSPGNIAIFDYSKGVIFTVGRKLGGAMLESMRQHEAFIFPALGHPTPVAIVEFLSHCEMSVSQSCESFGVEQANASQYLAVLWSKHIVETRREGNQIFDRPRGPRLAKVLAKIRDYFNARITEATEMFRDEQTVAIKNTQETGR